VWRNIVVSVVHLQDFHFCACDGLQCLHAGHEGLCTNVRLPILEVQGISLFPYRTRAFWIGRRAKMAACDSLSGVSTSFALPEEDPCGQWGWGSVPQNNVGRLPSAKYPDVCPSALLLRRASNPVRAVLPRKQRRAEGRILKGIRETEPMTACLLGKPSQLYLLPGVTDTASRPRTAQLKLYKSSRATLSGSTEAFCPSRTADASSFHVCSRAGGIWRRHLHTRHKVQWQVPLAHQ
jgi:hypothetical protein